MAKRKKKSWRTLLVFIELRNNQKVMIPHRKKKGTCTHMAKAGSTMTGVIPRPGSKYMKKYDNQNIDPNIKTVAAKESPALSDHNPAMRGAIPPANSAVARTTPSPFESRICPK
jgi:hypothetical protein